MSGVGKAGRNEHGSLWDQDREEPLGAIGGAEFDDGCWRADEHPGSWWRVV